MTLCWWVRAPRAQRQAQQRQKYWGSQPCSPGCPCWASPAAPPQGGSTAQSALSGQKPVVSVLSLRSVAVSFSVVLRVLQKGSAAPVLQCPTQSPVLGSRARDSASPASDRHSGRRVGVQSAVRPCPAFGRRETFRGWVSQWDTKHSFLSRNVQTCKLLSKHIESYILLHEVMSPWLM